MKPSIEDIREDFDLLDSWESRYRYIIELGEAMPRYPDDARDAAHKVQGCVSQVWLLTALGDGPDPVVTFTGDSDAHIVKGLVAIMIALFSEQRASAIAALDADAVMRSLGLDEHLTPQRANGLRAMVRRMKHDAATALAGVPG